jgi:predicted ribosome quality control (RQC) complex YloA/Tae2 family protein
VKAWTVHELDNVVASLEPLLGSRLQEVQTTAQDVVLGFYSASGVLWLWIDLNGVNPGLLPWMHYPFRAEVQKTPLLLFLRAHFVGRTLRSVKRPAALGRVVVLRFGHEDDALEIEVRLFAQGRNLIARAGAKSISWRRVQELSAPQEFTSQHALRSLEVLRQEWLASRGVKGEPKPAKTTGDPKTKVVRELDKKKSALGKVQDELKRKHGQPWRQVGDWIKTHQALDVPKEWEPFVDRRRKLAWNIEQCFSKAREGEMKIAGTEKRLNTLKDEIAQLERRLSGPLELEAAKPRPPAQPTLNKMQAHGRTLHLSDDLTAVMGKSAADNMKILRRARAWDLWFHLRDFPSSHAILFRNKSANVGDGKIFEVIGWFVRNHLGPKAAQHAGEKFDVVMTECRYVKPIKGDKIGRVTYHDERILIYQFPG